MKGKSPYRKLKKKCYLSLPCTFLSYGVLPQLGKGHLIVFAGCQVAEEGFQTFLGYRFAVYCKSKSSSPSIWSEMILFIFSFYLLGEKLQRLSYLVKLIQQKHTISPPQEIQTQGFFKACRQHGQHFLFLKKTPPCYEALCIDELLLKFLTTKLRWLLIRRAALAMLKLKGILFFF